MSNGDDDGFVDDPRGNAYQSVGFLKDYVGDTYRYQKDINNYFFTFKTPVMATLGAGGEATNVRARTQNGLLVDANSTPHPLTQLYNIYAQKLAERVFDKEPGPPPPEYIQDALTNAQAAILDDPVLVAALENYLQ